LSRVGSALIALTIKAATPSLPSETRDYPTYKTCFDYGLDSSKARADSEILLAAALPFEKGSSASGHFHFLRPVLTQPPSTPER